MEDRSAREIDVGELLQDRTLGRFHFVTFGLCLLILFVDGLDYSAPIVAAPAILKEFNADTGAMGLLFSMGFVGILTGSVFFGWIGDRYGRKVGAVLGVMAYSVPALMTVFATSFDQLTILRCLAGLGIGGVIPNIVALLTETAPQRFRVTFVMAVFIGYSSGNAAIGQAAAWLIPQFGWPVVFLVAGTAGMILSVVLAFALPESIPFLATTKAESPQLRALVARLAPELAIDENTRFAYRRPAAETKFSLNLLFDDFRRVATPLIWIAFLAESMTYLTLTAWIVVLLERAGLSPAEAATAYSYAQLSAIAAILVLARLFDRFGPVTSAAAATISVVSIAAIGTPGLSPTAITAIAIFAIACASATHQSLNGMVGGFYPTIVRGNGVGYATGMGRVGAIIGPGVAGILLQLVPAQTVLVSIAAPDIVVAACCLLLARYAGAQWQMGRPVPRAHS